MRKFIVGFVSGVLSFAAVGYLLCEFGECHSLKDFCDSVADKVSDALDGAD